MDVAVLTVSWADPLPPVITVGLMLQLAWLSDRPLSANDTSSVNPFTGETETAYETAPPAGVLAEDGDTLAGQRPIRCCGRLVGGGRETRSFSVRGVSPSVRRSDCGAWRATGPSP
jgi:hypothetical protein